MGIKTNEAAAWPESRWIEFDARLRRRALGASDAAAWSWIVRAARCVMRSFTTSFFIVSRFLPRAKRDMVEVVYAAVRQPDEVVDSFPLDAAGRLQRLEAWGAGYETARAAGGLRAALAAGAPCFLAGFAEVMRRTGIPADHYRAFLQAMRQDVQPQPFSTMDDLVDSYVYGSAVVVGYFLTHIYGASAPGRFDTALRVARHLGIALQLTNFARDVSEDLQRGRVYLPLDMLHAEGVTDPFARDAATRDGLGRAARRLAAAAADGYRRASEGLDAFAADSRVAIRACMDVYGLLNRRILESRDGIDRRESVPLREKLRPLPISKYWRIPLGYLGA